MYPAFEFDKIYKIENGKYIENYKGFEMYLTRRKEHYLHWKKRIENSEGLNSDSKRIIEDNKKEFKKELNRLIELVEEKLM